MLHHKISPPECPSGPSHATAKNNHNTLLSTTVSDASFTKYRQKQTNVLNGNYNNFLDGTQQIVLQEKPK